MSIDVIGQNSSNLSPSKHIVFYGDVELEHGTSEGGQLPVSGSTLTTVR